MTCGLDREFLEQPVGQISWAAVINRARLVLLAQCPLCPDSDQMLPRNEMTRCARSRPASPMRSPKGPRSARRYYDAGCRVAPTSESWAARRLTKPGRALL